MKRAVSTSMLLVISILVLGVILSSCGTQPSQTSEEPASTPETTTPSAHSSPPSTMPKQEMTGPVQIVTATLGEWSVKLDKTTVNAGNVKFIVTNNGPKYPHALRIVNKATGKSVGDQVAVTLDEIDSVVINLAPGTYEVYCPLSGHKEKGMATTLTVK